MLTGKSAEIKLIRIEIIIEYLKNQAAKADEIQ